MNVAIIFEASIHDFKKLFRVKYVNVQFWGPMLGLNRWEFTQKLNTYMVCIYFSNILAPDTSIVSIKKKKKTISSY